MLSRLTAPIGALKRRLIASRWRLVERTDVVFPLCRDVIPDKTVVRRFVERR
jgi:hypothetical protein